MRHRSRSTAEVNDLMTVYCTTEDAWLAKTMHQGIRLGSPKIPSGGKRIRRSRKAKRGISDITDDGSGQIQDEPSG